MQKVKEKLNNCSYFNLSVIASSADWHFIRKCSQHSHSISAFPARAAASFDVALSLSSSRRHRECADRGDEGASCGATRETSVNVRHARRPRLVRGAQVCRLANSLASPLCSTPFSVKSTRSQCCDPTESQSRGPKIASSQCSIVVFVCFLSLVKLIARIEMAQDCAISTARDWFCPQWQMHKWHWTKKAKPRKLL